MRHRNIPIFIPHLGCPNSCVFCNQRSISGKNEFDRKNVRCEIERALETIDRDCECEIAFFGGSFTGIDRELMIYLLETAEEYVKGGRVSSIRLSTRPDYISEEILTILSRYSVKNIELGIQSMSDKVLKSSMRGHTSADSVKACRLVKSYGFKLVGQMMTGLPSSNVEDELETARIISSLGADGARIYPTMVFAKTKLEEMLKMGEYTPPSLSSAIERTAAVYKIFLKNGISVLKVGLHAGEALYSENGISAGSYHPAMGELVEGRVFRDILEAELIGSEPLCGKTLTVYVSPSFLSKAIGQRGCNRDYFISKYNLKRLCFAVREGIKPFQLEIEHD